MVIRLFLSAYWTEIVSQKTRRGGHNDVPISLLDRGSFTKDQKSVERMFLLASLLSLLASLLDRDSFTKDQKL